MHNKFVRGLIYAQLSRGLLNCQGIFILFTLYQLRGLNCQEVLISIIVHGLQNFDISRFLKNPLHVHSFILMNVLKLMSQYNHILLV